MKNTRVHLECSSQAVDQFRAAASLHSHTLHSRETLAFINRLGRQFAPLEAAIRRGEARYRKVHGSSLDLTRAWWTPPIAPRDAWQLETDHIHNDLGLAALVSLSDHDSIEAPLSLHVMGEGSQVPISTEWTVPYERTFFHMGVHNLPASRAVGLFSAMTAFTGTSDLRKLPELLEAIAAHPETLIVLNHPCWDEKSIGYDQHCSYAVEFIHRHRAWLHALELNGLRPWSENRAVLQMAQTQQMVLVSGGDRHSLEPNTVLDLTRESTFSGYAQQVRSGHSDILITDRYREKFLFRILQNLEDILADHPRHGRGWTHWSDRVFYQCEDGEVRSLTTLFINRVPSAVKLFVNAIGVMRRYGILNSCRFAFPRQELLL